MRMKAENSGKKIWGINKVHKDSEWLSNIKSELLNLDRKQDVIISKKKSQENASKDPSLESPWKR